MTVAPFPDQPPPGQGYLTPPLDELVRPLTSTDWLVLAQAQRPFD